VAAVADAGVAVAAADVAAGTAAADAIGAIEETAVIAAIANRQNQRIFRKGESGRGWIRLFFS
jgi:hypothetical protein